MKEKNVWEEKEMSDVPNNRRIIGCKWVFKIKRNGIYRARLCGLGYNQIPGIDFQDHYAPVTHDITFRMLLVIMLVKKLKARLVDVETAFLYGELEENIYMKCPDGLTIKKSRCLKLNKTIYGLVQSARQWWVRLVNDLRERNFVLCQTDPCVMFTIHNKEMVMLCIYVDDCLLIGNREGIETVTTLFKSLYSVKCVNDLHDYLGCDINFDYKNGRATIDQPSL